MTDTKVINSFEAERQQNLKEFRGMGEAEFFGLLPKGKWEKSGKAVQPAAKREFRFDVSSLFSNYFGQIFVREFVEICDVKTTTADDPPKSVQVKGVRSVISVKLEEDDLWQAVVREEVSGEYKDNPVDNCVRKARRCFKKMFKNLMTEFEQEVCNE